MLQILSKMAMLMVPIPEQTSLSIIWKMCVKLLAKSLAQSKNSINVSAYIISIITGQTNVFVWCLSKLKKKSQYLLSLLALYFQLIMQPELFLHYSRQLCVCFAQSHLCHEFLHWQQLMLKKKQTNVFSLQTLEW